MGYWRYLWVSFGDPQVRYPQWFMGRLPKAFLVAQLVKNPPEMWETWCDLWVGKIPWRRKWLPVPVSLPGEWGSKGSDMTEQLSLKNLKRPGIPSGSWEGFLIKINGIDEI